MTNKMNFDELKSNNKVITLSREAMRMTTGGIGGDTACLRACTRINQICSKNPTFGPCDGFDYFTCVNQCGLEFPG